MYQTDVLVDKPTKLPSCLFNDVCFDAAPSNHTRPISLNIDNGLPAVAV